LAQHDDGGDGDDHDGRDDDVRVTYLFTFSLFSAAKVSKHCCNLVATGNECCFSATVLQK